jgi:hypothetical protein
MAQPPTPGIRELLLAEIKAQEPTGPISASLQPDPSGWTVV